jgi:hypothetical protein
MCGSRIFSNMALAVAFAAGASGALPDPPLQRDPWQPLPVAGIPEFVPGFAEVLFNAGLADPRGGEYRHVDLSGLSSDGHAISTHAWYFPQGFAVGWDGLVHRVARAGERVDLHGDVSSASQGGYWNEGSFTIPLRAEPVGVALMLRLGEPELARQLFAKIRTNSLQLSPESESERQHREKLDWWAAASTSWLSGVFHQAVEAHAVGNDQLAIDIAGVLSAARPALDAEWKTLGTAPGFNRDPTMAFLDPMPLLVADSERRLKEAPRPPFDPEVLRRLAPSSRIAALIDRLEDINEHQSGQPGGVCTTCSPIGKLLVDEGADAVDRPAVGRNGSRPAIDSLLLVWSQFLPASHFRGGSRRGDFAELLSS